jgi:protein phosphatase
VSDANSTDALFTPTLTIAVAGAVLVAAVAVAVYLLLRGRTTPALKQAPKAAPDEPHASDPTKVRVLVAPSPPAPANPPSGPRIPTLAPAGSSIGEVDEEVAIEIEADPIRPSDVTVVPWLADLSAHDDEPTQTGAFVVVDGSGSSDRGQRRKQNEDALFVDAAKGLYVVADGMGGHKGGARASNLAVDVVRRRFEEAVAADLAADEPACVTVAWKPAGPSMGEIANTPFDGELPRRAARLATAVSEANDAIFREANADPNYAGMGTTLVVAQFVPNKQRLYVGHVGDSRCYRLRGGEIEQVTRDHTMETEFGVRGPHGNRLARAIGISPGVKIDVILDRPLPGDVYLLCSDGLTKTVPTDLIGHILGEFPDPERAANELVTMANTNGGIDNVTAVVVRVALPS